MTRQTTAPFTRPRPRPAGRARLLPLLAGAALSVAPLVARPAAAQTSATPSSYTVTDLGVLSGSAYSRTGALNDAAGVVRVVGHTVTSKNLGYHAFYWDSVARTLTDIGTLPGGQSSYAVDVNGNGDVAGYGATTPPNAYSSDGGNDQAFYWSKATGLIPLSRTLSGGAHTGTADTSRAARISDAGIIVGYVYSAAWGTLPVYWQKDGTGTYQCHELPGLPGGAASNSNVGASAINARGDIAGSVPDPTGTGDGRAVVWKNQSTNPATGQPDPAAPAYGSPVDSGVVSSWGSLINAAGQVTGNYSATVGGGFFWTPGSAAIDLGNLGYGNTRVYGLNDSGQVTGDSWRLSDGTRHAYLWTPGGTGGVAGNPQMRDLGTLGGPSSWGRALNGSGVVVGLSNMAGPNTLNRGFRWDAVNGIKDLNDPALTPSRGTFSLLQEAKKIGDRGNIAGDGIITKGGGTHAYVLTPR